MVQGRKSINEEPEEEYQKRRLRRAWRGRKLRQNDERAPLGDRVRVQTRSRKATLEAAKEEN